MSDKDYALRLSCGPTERDQVKLLTPDGRDLAKDLCIMSIAFKIEPSKRAVLTLELEDVKLDNAQFLDETRQFEAAADARKP